MCILKIVQNFCKYLTDKTIFANILYYFHKKQILKTFFYKIKITQIKQNSFRSMSDIIKCILLFTKIS